ncbi:MAG: DJ-1/PfpI family protein [Halanaeroarchaeum sp.]
MNDDGTVGVLVFEGVDAIATAGVVQVLRAGAADGCGLDTTLYSLVPSDRVETSAGLAIVPDDVLIGTPDVVVIPGGVGSEGTGGSVADDLPERVAGLADGGATVAGVGPGVGVLAEAGLLDGRTVTGPPNLAADLEGVAGEVSEDSVVEDGTVLTAATPSDGALLAMRLLESRGCRAVEDVAARVGRDWPDRSGQS